MAKSAHIFVGIIFLTIAISFFATTGILMYEFREDRVWLDFLALDSHFFVFFPTFGIVALYAFYLPSVAFVDLYFRHVEGGPVRFGVGAVTLILTSLLISSFILSSENRSIWDIHPETLKTDAGQPSYCLDRGGDCDRIPLLQAVGNLRALSSNRLGLAPFVRTCSDPGLIEPDPNPPPKRFCVATTPYSVATKTSPGPKLVSDAVCCRAKDELVRTVNALYTNEANRSRTGQLHRALLPLKVFFLLVLLTISIVFLTLRFEAIQKHYHRHRLAIDIGLIIGTVAALFFPLMSEAFVQSLIVLTGDNGRGPFSNMVPILLIAFLIWALLIGFFFFRSNSSQTEKFLKVAGGVFTVLGLLKYDVVVDYVVFLIGSGAQVFSLGGLVALSVVMLWLTIMLWRWSLEAADEKDGS